MIFGDKYLLLVSDKNNHRFPIAIMTKKKRSQYKRKDDNDDALHLLKTNFNLRTEQ